MAKGSEEMEQISTAEQIVEMAFWMRDVPLKLSLMNKVEKELKNDLELVEELIGDWQSETTFYPTGVEMGKAISILEKAEAVAKDMNEIEEGCWAENLESITNKLTRLRENENE